VSRRVGPPKGPSAPLSREPRPPVHRRAATAGGHSGFPSRRDGRSNVWWAWWQGAWCSPVLFLGRVHSPRWRILTEFAGVNVLLSAAAGWCPSRPAAVSAGHAHCCRTGAGTVVRGRGRGRRWWRRWPWFDL